MFAGFDHTESHSSHIITTVAAFLHSRKPRVPVPHIGQAALMYCTESCQFWDRRFRDRGNAVMTLLLSFATSVKCLAAGFPVACTPCLLMTLLRAETTGDTHGLRWSGCGTLEVLAGLPHVPVSDAHGRAACHREQPPARLPRRPSPARPSRGSERAAPRPPSVAHRRSHGTVQVGPSQRAVSTQVRRILRWPHFTSSVWSKEVQRP